MTGKLLALAACFCIATAAPAFAQAKNTVLDIKGFTSDPVEVYDKNEELLGEYAVDKLSLDEIKVVDATRDMLLLKYTNGYELGWVFKTDVRSAAGCREAGTGQAQQSNDRSSMGLDGSLCK